MRGFSYALQYGILITKMARIVRIIDYIDESPLCSSAEISASLSMPASTVKRSLRLMVKAGRIHIADWDRSKTKAGRYARLYVAGPGTNKKEPRQDPEVRKSRKSLLAKRRRARAAVIAQSAGKDNPFACVMAQVMAWEKRE